MLRRSAHIQHDIRSVSNSLGVHTISQQTLAQKVS
jgi:hypothetical protein